MLYSSHCYKKVQNVACTPVQKTEKKDISQTFTRDVSAQKTRISCCIIVTKRGAGKSLIYDIIRGETASYLWPSLLLSLRKIEVRLARSERKVIIDNTECDVTCRHAQFYIRLKTRYYYFANLTRS